MKAEHPCIATLEEAIAIAAKAHEGQIDKAGAPYILHSLRVMLHVNRIEERIVGVLHDVVEDTPWTMEKLRNAGFSEEILKALDSVTKRENEDYTTFALRARANPIGRKVKLADLADNLDVSRIAVMTDKDRARLEKYEQARTLLLG